MKVSERKLRNVAEAAKAKPSVLPDIIAGKVTVAAARREIKREQIVAKLEDVNTRAGCRDALVVWKEQGILLDGHNRYAICRAHDVAFATVERTFAERDDALLWMLSNQLGRRNLDTLALIGLASKREDILREKARKNLQDGGGDKKSPAARSPSKKSAKAIEAKGPVLAVEKPAPTVPPVHVREEAAKAAGVSHPTYTAGKAVLAKGSEKLIELVRTGEASISAAARTFDTTHSRKLVRCPRTRR
jgi:hypothetical protein